MSEAAAEPMTLQTYQRPSAFVPFGPDPAKGGLDLKALTLNTVGELISDHLGGIAVAVDLYREMREHLEDVGSLDRFVVTLIKGVPDLAAAIIATAAGLPELTEKAKDLAFGVQLRALSEIMRLSLEDAGGLKNVFATLPGVVAELRSLQNRTTQIPQTH